MDVHYLSLSCVPPCCYVCFSAGLFSECPPQLHSGRERCRCVMTQWSLLGCRCLERHFWTNPVFRVPFFVGIFMGSGWCLDCIWGFWVDIYSCTSISHRVQKQWNLLPWLIKTSAVYSAQGEPLPVINRAARCCRQETLCGYKYGTCHCCDYSQLSAMTPHCLLLVDFFFTLYQTIESDKAERCSVAKLNNPSDALEKWKGQEQLELELREGKATHIYLHNTATQSAPEINQHSAFSGLAFSQSISVPQIFLFPPFTVQNRLEGWAGRLLTVIWYLYILVQKK